MKDDFILACQGYFVKQRESAEVRKHHRVQRDTVAEESISPRAGASYRPLSAQAQACAHPGTERGGVGAVAALTGD
ncbi:Uncharacterised protein [Serratia fonticola]|uniref:hypothetical protein n=1 Tax=Serratia fonticola TaxID=47917 RepID=UPI0021794C37|nr:hypothetical protein [Serratia fonticola]CAI2039008.1 Uncharacterised protein [Serratia fonticola]